MKLDSPLRYPGGKGRLSPFFMDLMENEGLTGGWYCEPYAGGAGVALALLFGEYVQRIYINDLNPAIYAFWKSVLDQSEDLVRLIHDVSVTVEEWRRQQEIYRSPDGHSTLELGFATFFLNRTSRSGIIGRGGVIGGLAQEGKWKIDARYPRAVLIRRIEKVAGYRNRVNLSCIDAAEFLRKVVPALGSNGLVYLDPPYFEKGERLYEKSYKADDHKAIAALVKSLSCPWVVTYDDVTEIREMYRGEVALGYELNYSAARRRVGREVMFASPFFGDFLKLQATPLAIT